MNENLRHWDALRTPPGTALKPITGGRLSGMTDISPQWRIQAMTEHFGPVGFGWRYLIEDLWTVPGAGGEIIAFARVRVWYREGTEWSEPVPGIGGSMLVEQEHAGLHTSDEAYKMAVTDALSVALKAIGVGADVYLGMVDGKHSKRPPAPAAKQQPQPTLPKVTTGEMVASQNSADSWAGRKTPENITQARIKEVTISKQGTKSDGTPWVLYALTTTDGFVFTTFSKSVVEIAEQAATAETLVSLRWVKDKYGGANVTEAKLIVPEVMSPAEYSQSPPDDIPF